MRRGRRILNGVLVAAIVGELIVLIGHPLFGWGPQRHRPVATPQPLSIIPAAPPSAREVLLSLAAAAARRPAGASAGRFAYVTVQTWSLADQGIGNTGASRPLPQTIESWRGADGSGRTVTVAQTPSGAETLTRPLTGSEPPPLLTGGQGALAHRLHLGYPSREPVAEQFATLTRIAAGEPVPGSAEAAMLRLLARIPQLVYDGAAVDRARRHGVAVSLESALSGTDIRYTLVLDAATGALLESDEALVGDGQGRRYDGVAPGGVIAYTLVRGSGRVDALGQRP